VRLAKRREKLGGIIAGGVTEGTMRTNLVKLMDAAGLNVLLGIASTASLWGVDSHRAHFTSALRYPTFVDGENYSRSPDMSGVPFLLDRSRNWLKEELSLFPDAVIVAS
jgi:hypothetical protein